MGEARLTLVREGDGAPWLFLPGGPGMGSESLQDLILLLDLNAPLYRVDLPEDGTNLVGLPITLERWQQAIVELTQNLEQVVWVGHSFGGMLLQTIPEIEKHCKGLVLANTAPDNQWFTGFAQRAAAHHLPNVSQLRKNLLAHPTDDNYKAYMLNSISYYFTEHGLTDGIKLFQNCPFQVKPYLWALEHFHPIYQATYIPKCPTLVLNGAQDYMTPSTSFGQKPYQDRENIQITTIEHAGHFPWVEQPEEVMMVFAKFNRKLGP